MQTSGLYGYYRGHCFPMLEHPYRECEYLLVTEDSALAQRLGFARPSSLYYTDRLRPSAYVLSLERRELDSGYYAELRTYYQDWVYRLEYTSETYLLYAVHQEDEGYDPKSEPSSEATSVEMSAVENIWEHRIPLDEILFDEEMMIPIQSQGYWMHIKDERVKLLQEELIALRYGDNMEGYRTEEDYSPESNDEASNAIPQKGSKMLLHSIGIIIAIVLFFFKVYQVFSGVANLTKSHTAPQQAHVPSYEVLLMGSNSQPLGVDSLSVNLFFAISGQSRTIVPSALRIFGKQGRIFNYPDCVDADGNLSPDLAFTSQEIRQTKHTACAVYKATFHVHKDLLGADDLFVGIFYPPAPEPLGHTLLPYAIPAPLSESKKGGEA